MRLDSNGRSSDLEDRRGESGGGGFRFGGGGGGVRIGSLGLGGVLLLLAISYFTGTDVFSLLDGGTLDTPSESASPGTSAPFATTPAEEKLADDASAVLDDVQNTWQRILPGQYQRTKLVLFRDGIDSACGMASSATGPFYCPADHKVYLDLSFYTELRQRFGAPGDFAQAYVLAHELGHHVQSLLGTDENVRRLQSQYPARANEFSVKLELQADCYAGIWGHSTQERQRLDPGDIQEGLAAAGAIGDDRIQRMGGSRVAPERFTHGTSQQRVDWLTRGLTTGRVESCDTFGSGGAR